MMKDMLMKIWNWLNGNKTIICLAAIAIIQKLIDLEMIADTKTIEFVLWILVALTTGAFAHHVQKGYLSEDKN